MTQQEKERAEKRALETQARAREILALKARAEEKHRAEVEVCASVGAFSLRRALYLFVAVSRHKGAHVRS